VAGPGKKWLIGCGLGCGIPILLLLLVTIGGGIFMMKPFNKAVDTQKELSATYGKRSDYVPAAGGLNPERLEKFMNVRRELVPYCDNFNEISAKFEEMEKLDAGGEEPSKGEVFNAVGNMMSAVMGIAGNIGRFTATRNDALLNQDMGLGEYIWIYTLVYNSWLEHPPNTDFEERKNGEYSAEEKRVIQQLMRSHAQALTEVGRTEEAVAWTAEAGHLERSEGTGVPWVAHQLPEAVSQALEPYRTELAELYCQATSSFEFSQVKKKGLTISSE